VGLQAFCFICGLSGAAVILDYSTYDSKIQPIIERSMYNLISNSYEETASFILRVIQETVRKYRLLKRKLNLFQDRMTYLWWTFDRSDAVELRDPGITHGCINHCLPSVGTPLPETLSITAASKNYLGSWRRDRGGSPVWRWRCACFM